MSLKTQIQNDIKAAMRARESARLSTLRLLMAAIKQREIDDRIEASDENIIDIIEKLVKQRRDAATQYEAGNRPELAEAERQEIAVLAAYLPAPLPAVELDAAINSAIEETGACGMADMGRVMALLKPRLAGRADMGKVSGQVKAKLSG